MALQVFFGLTLGLTPSMHNLCTFSPGHSRPFLKHDHTVSTHVSVPL